MTKIHKSLVLGRTATPQRTVRKSITTKAIAHIGHGPSNEVEQHLLHTDCWDRIRRQRQPPYTSARP